MLVFSFELRCVDGFGKSVGKFGDKRLVGIKAMLAHVSEDCVHHLVPKRICDLIGLEFPARGVTRATKLNTAIIVMNVPYDRPIEHGFHHLD
jgi:hypothetical protein